MPLSDQHLLYKLFADYFLEGTHIIVKPHPDDIAGTDFLGVSYGFGIKKLVDYPFPVADSPEDISDYIINTI